MCCTPAALVVGPGRTGTTALAVGLVAGAIVGVAAAGIAETRCEANAGCTEAAMPLRVGLGGAVTALVGLARAYVLVSVRRGG